MRTAKFLYTHSYKELDRFNNRSQRRKTEIKSLEFTVVGTKKYLSSVN